MPSPFSKSRRRHAAGSTLAATAALVALLAAGPALAAEPDLALYDSAGDAPASGPVTVSALVSRTARKVSFYVDGRKRSTDRTAPWSMEVDTSSLSPGQHTVAAKVRGQGWRAGAWKTILVAGDSALTPTVAGLPTLKPKPKKKARAKKRCRRARAGGRRRCARRPRRPVKPAPQLPAAVAPVAPPLGPALFTGDFETGDHSQWTAVQETAADRIQIVPDPVRQGRYASRHEVRQGDSLYGGARAELLWGDDRRLTLTEGKEYVFQWSSYFAPGLPSPDPNQGHSSFVQWKAQGTGGPPTAMSLRGERIALRVSNVDRWAIPLTRGVWHDFSVRMRFSSNPSVGFAEVTHNGVPQRFDNGQTRVNYATLDAGKSSYLKLGYYRAAAIQPVGVVFHDGMRVVAG